MNDNILKVRKLHPNAIIPTKSHPYDAGFDLCYCGENNLVIYLGERKVISTGIAIQIPDGFVGLIWDKSSLGSKGLKVMGGVVDAGYRGEIKVILQNNGTHFEIIPGMKIAQLLIQRIENLDIKIVDSLDESSRGSGGFGSTGK